MLLLEDQNCHSTYTCNEVQKLKLLLLPVEPDSQISEITAKFKANKISWKQTKKTSKLILERINYWHIM